MFDYEILRLIWWALLGVLLIGFAVTGGFDLGVAMLYRVLGRNDAERRAFLETIEPTWEGNQVWFILGGGAIFAAWPILYAVSFSGFYLAMFLVLAALILRPVGFMFRNKVEDERWRGAWDVALVIGGAVPALVFGVALGNVLLGVPFTFDTTMRMTYSGGFFDLLGPFGLLAGLVSMAMLAMHGGTYAAMKTGAPLSDRAATAARLAAVAFMVLFSLAGILVATRIDALHITSVIDPGGPSNPLGKTVELVRGGWMRNYATYPWMLAAPVAGYLGALGVLLLVRTRQGIAFFASAVSVAATICTVGFSLYPFLLPSSLLPAASLTIWDASSSQRTLALMLVATLVFIPIILAYTAWVFRVLRGRITLDQLHDGAY
jgi:cytochrome bd ubiquinol oxidase subunit II